jgi:hypothetical protein
MASTTNTTTAATASDGLDIPDFLKRDKTAATKPTPAAKPVETKAKPAAAKKPEPKAQPKTVAKTKTKHEPKKATPAKPEAKKAAKPAPKKDAKPAAPKKESKVDQLIAVLKSPKGATNEEAAEKLGFKTAQSVRGTINGPVKKRHKVVSERDAERGTVYRIK